MTRQIYTPAEVFAMVQKQGFNPANLTELGVSANFTWAEVFTKRSLSDIRQAKLEHYENAARLAQRLQDVRQQLGNRSITITSWWRDPASNARVGGARNSFHLRGMAADIQVMGMPPHIVQQRLDPTWFGGLGYGQSFTHLDTRPARARFSYS